MIISVKFQTDFVARLSQPGLLVAQAAKDGPPRVLTISGQRATALLELYPLESSFFVIAAPLLPGSSLTGLRGRP